MSNLVPFNLPSRNRSPFDAIRNVDQDERGEFEWWSAREAIPYLGYANWQNMQNIIRKAKAACRNRGCQVADHFIDTSKMRLQGGPRQQDVHLSRFGMYLLAMNGDPEKREIAAAQSYFVEQTRRAETQLPPMSEQPQPVILRPWSERLNKSIMEHRRYIVQRLPKGAFSVYTGTIPDILTLEDVLLEHLLPLLQSDGPDNSIGQRYPKFRKDKPWIGQVLAAPLYMPSQENEVTVYVYLASEWPHFREWLESTYFPENLPEYLCRKYPWKTYGLLTPPSAADHTCKRLTGEPAKLAPPVRAQLTAAGGFAPRGYRQLTGPQQRELF